jgi:hypothetical protein
MNLDLLTFVIAIVGITASFVSGFVVGYRQVFRDLKRDNKAIVQTYKMEVFK